MAENSDSQQHTQQPQFNINKIYIKDLSSESPNAPNIHRQKWAPNIDLNLGNRSQAIDEESGIFEVSLLVKVSAKIDDQIAYLAELDQSGIFTITGMDDEQRNFIIGAVIPNLLYPYACEVISSLSQKAGFPPIVLNPIDFASIYHQHLEQQAPKSANETQELSENSSKTMH